MLDLNLFFNISKTIAAGPFKGQTGKVLDILKNKLRLELPSLGIFVTLSKATA